MTKFLPENIRVWILKEAIASGDCLNFLFDAEEVLDQIMREMIGSPDTFYGRWSKEVVDHETA